MFSPKFVHKPYKRFVFREIANLSKENFTKLFLNLEENFVIWSNGVLLHLAEFDGSRNDKTKYFEFVHYSECPKLPEFLEYKGMKLEVIDVSDSKFHRDFVEWLKHTSFWKKSQSEVIEN